MSPERPVQPAADSNEHTDRERIAAIVEAWVVAAHTGDLEGVLAHHGRDLVMFDVPAPEQGLRGVDAYRDAWPAFFEWQRGGATFELETLDVTVGDDVGFAWALLRCGTTEELEDEPDRRLRITFGLVRRDGDWVVTHEHHSFTQR